MAGFPKGKDKKGESPSRNARPGVPLDKNIIIQCLRAYDGNLSRTADHMGTTRFCIRRRIDDDPELQEELKQARERQIDRLEKVVFERAEESNDTTLQLFILKTQGRHRGWDQSEAQNTAKDIATAAFDFIINKSKPSQ
jgi:hypothetical protein